MVEIDPEQAARDLAEADQRLRHGAELAVPRWWQLLFSLYFVVLGAKWDIPAELQRWYGVLLLTLGLVMMASIIRARTRARARPLPMPAGWRIGLLIGVVAITSYAVMVSVGLALRSLAVPAPFTLSSLLVVIAISLLLTWTGQRWGGSYVQRVRRGQW